MSKELKPCPFCGSPAQESRDTIGSYSYYCADPDCCTLNKDFAHHATGRKAWNTRTAPETSRPAADESAKPVYQFRYFGTGDWTDVSKEEFDRLSAGVTAEDMRFRTLYTHPTPVASKEAVTLSDEASVQFDKLKPGHCHKCGLPLSENPHPEAGKPSHYLQVGCPKECIPCLTLSQHSWATRAMKAESDGARDALRYRRMREIYRESGRIDAARESDAAYDARIDASIAQRDASKAEPTS